jgi:hypothetical protein
MKIVLAGATGFIGQKLIQRLLQEKHELILLTRDPEKAAQKFGRVLTPFKWDGRTQGDWLRLIDGADAVINLTGESIAGKRWNRRQKEKIRSSRIEATQIIVQAIEAAENKPSALINASAVGYYGDVPTDTVTEKYPASTDFLGMLSEKWENTAMQAKVFGVRVVCPRIGIVLGADGGALEKMILPFKLFAGGPLGSGNQWFPWIHIDDLIGAFLFVLKNQDISGAVNFTAPNPVTMKEFCTKLGKVLGRPSWIPVPVIVLRLAVGEFANFLLSGQKAVPEKLAKLGYDFTYEDVESALRNILKS